MISPEKFETNSRPSAKVTLSRPGYSSASTVFAPVRGSMRSTCPECAWVDTMYPSASNFTESGTPSSVATTSGLPPVSGLMRQISLAPITGK